MTRTPARVRAWGWFMDRFDSMHVSRMSASDIAHNQSMRHVPAPIRSILFGSRASGVLTEDHLVPRASGDGSIPVRVYRPKAESSKQRPIVIYFHGGGWTLFGGLDVCDWLPSRLSARLDSIVIAVDYSLAPEHPYPAAIDDCWDVTRWAATAPTAHQLGADSGRIAVVGDSAGGNLSAAVALRARDSGGPGLRAQGLIYPVTSPTLDDGSMHENSTAPVLHRADMSTFIHLYATDRPDVLADPLAFPTNAASLADLPPALVQLGERDVLRDQGREFGERLAADGTDVTVVEYPGAPHGWVTYPNIIPTSGPATDDLVDFLRGRLRE